MWNDLIQGLMLDKETMMMLVENTGITLYMTLLSTAMAYVIGLPMGIALVVTAPGGLCPDGVVKRTSLKFWMLW